MARKPISPEIQASVLIKSRRRCCICFGLNRDTALKAGQIAHLDQNAGNASEENLAFLCFDHHDQYDSTTRQSKNLTIQEVKAFRSELHQAIQLAFGATVQFGDASSSSDQISGHYIVADANSSAEVHVRRLNGDLFHVSGLAVNGLKRSGGPNSGEIDFLASMKEQSLVFSSPRQNGAPYQITLTFLPMKLLVQEANAGGVHGMGVSFSGEYEKAT